MKFHTTDEQTDKLIELGYTFPKGYPFEPHRRPAYSIGELIALLPPVEISDLAEEYRVTVDGEPPKEYIERELIDALWKACVEYKNGDVKTEMEALIIKLMKENESNSYLTRLALDYAQFIDLVAKMREYQTRAESAKSLVEANGMGQDTSSIERAQMNEKIR